MVATIVAATHSPPVALACATPALTATSIFSLLNAISAGHRPYVSCVDGVIGEID
jgi:hypothetical protein